MKRIGKDSILTVSSQNVRSASIEVKPGTIIDQLRSEVAEDPKRFAVSMTCLPTLKATVTASTAS